MDDSQNPDFITYDLEYDAVISNSEPPIAFERSSYLLAFIVSAFDTPLSSC